MGISSSMIFENVTTVDAERSVQVLLGSSAVGQLVGT